MSKKKDLNVFAHNWMKLLWLGNQSENFQVPMFSFSEYCHQMRGGKIASQVFRVAKTCQSKKKTEVLLPNMTQQNGYFGTN